MVEGWNWDTKDKKWSIKDFEDRSELSEYFNNYVIKKEDFDRQETIRKQTMFRDIPLSNVDAWGKSGNWHTSTAVMPEPELSRNEVSVRFLRESLKTIFKNRSDIFKLKVEALFFNMTFEKIFDLFLQKGFANQLQNLDSMSETEVLNYIKLLLE